MLAGDDLISAAVLFSQQFIIIDQLEGRKNFHYFLKGYVDN